MDQGSSIAYVSRLDQPSLNNRPDFELKSLGHGVEDDRLVLCECTEMQRRFNLNTYTIIPNLRQEYERMHLKCRELTYRRVASPYSLALCELLH